MAVPVREFVAHGRITESHLHDDSCDRYDEIACAYKPLLQGRRRRRYDMQVLRPDYTHGLSL
jgi:hypothetical protein